MRHTVHGVCVAVLISVTSLVSAAGVSRALAADSEANAFGLAPRGLTGAGRAAGSDVLGEWRQPGGNRIQVYKCRDDICGRIVKVVDPSLKDDSNPQPRLRMRPLLGIQIIRSRRRTFGNGWKVDLYLPETGQTVAARLIPERADTLRVSRCAVLNLICQDETWARVR